MEVQRQNKASETLSAGAKGYSQRRAAKLREQEMSKCSVRIQANFRGKKERADPAAEANIRRERSKNDPQVQASAYLKEHKIMVSDQPALRRDCDSAGGEGGGVPRGGGLASAEMPDFSRPS